MVSKKEENQVPYLLGSSEQQKWMKEYFLLLEVLDSLSPEWYHWTRRR